MLLYFSFFLRLSLSQTRRRFFLPSHSYFIFSLPVTVNNDVTNTRSFFSLARMLQQGMKLTLSLFLLFLGSRWRRKWGQGKYTMGIWRSVKEIEIQREIDECDQHKEVKIMQNESSNHRSEKIDEEKGVRTSYRMIVTWERHFTFRHFRTPFSILAHLWIKSFHTFFRYIYFPSFLFL